MINRKDELLELYDRATTAEQREDIEYKLRLFDMIGENIFIPVKIEGVKFVEDMDGRREHLYLCGGVWRLASEVLTKKDLKIL